MIKHLLLWWSLLFHPHSKHQQEIDAMTHKAATHVLAIRVATKNIEENCPYIPQAYFDAMKKDLDKIAKDKSVADTSFREDFDELEDDFNSLLFAITVYDKVDAT